MTGKTHALSQILHAMSDLITVLSQRRLNLSSIYGFNFQLLLLRFFSFRVSPLFKYIQEHTQQFL